MRRPQKILCTSLRPERGLNFFVEKPEKTPFLCHIIFPVHLKVKPFYYSLWSRRLRIGLEHFDKGGYTCGSSGPRRNRWITAVKLHRARLVFKNINILHKRGAGRLALRKRSRIQARAFSLLSPFFSALRVFEFAAVFRHFLGATRPRKLPLH